MRKFTKDPCDGFFDEDSMPCRCSCGNYFDLNDGYTIDRVCGNGNRELVCQECFDQAQEEEECSDNDWDNDWDNGPENWGRWKTSVYYW